MAGEAHEKAERVRRKTHLPRDSPGFIRTQWLENFYETLYASNEPGFYIPYTVVFQYRRIYAAYFSDSDGAAASSSKLVMSVHLRVLVGCVQKVDKIADLGPEQVLEGLKDMRHGDLGVKRSDIVYSIPCRAYYIYSKRSEEGFAGEGKTNLSIEYFDDSAVTHFLTYRGKENNGILQQVQELTTPNVSTIRAYWTPHYCQLEVHQKPFDSQEVLKGRPQSRINVNRADASNVPLFERAVTFEGELHHSSSFPMSSRVESRVRDLLDRIVSSVRRCLPNNLAINLMILNFRIGPNGKVFFLYCNSLKLQYSDHHATSDLRDMDNIRPPSPKYVDNDFPPPGLRGSKKRFGRVCPSTNNRLGPYDDFKVKVQDIFIHFLWHGPREAS
ncbi:hypothetical protein GUITHDRAFT_137587 [Guillardia theta CCMP2712]|uniref:Uncharacterized protein n=1 Tax=Guillardia theta (strain CCMP2712) TaxID=905079 RepID=L1JG03_GUITC|nr:hypothetical protein GUITHDRAFT_137587 [Guillardia theta CCMP2712]EKX47421.1 hypothetical protein GUITHDRAFT_137587 [Guillardia theta CCMP2712]|eukprot:XP_005834401.1 hypothetical protein GUITHDRAFT_137587 [Guillardia theta CCMP2712]